MKKRLAIVCLSIFLGACGTGPRVMICISSPADNGFACVSAKGKKLFIPYAESENFVAFTDRDAKVLLDYCASKR
jgi:hypothetical protein